MRIIPAIDLMNGKCVRLSAGNFSQSTIYHDDPVDVAKRFEDNGLKYLHLVDLDGAKAGNILNLHVLNQISNQTNLVIDFGGGVQTNEDIQSAFDAGAAQITAGSIVVKNESLFLSWLKKYGPEKIILGADCKNETIVTNAWNTLSTIPVTEHILKYTRLGIRKVISTDISKDGMLQGPSYTLYTSILESCNINLVASGGVTTMEDLTRLKQIGCEGAIIGKAIYEGTITLKELSALC
jgi:phosphoribosylformimino-5-aminoimidazole carboxamide ribotide isomerase